MKKHLLICYNFHPSGGSEEAVGYQFSRISSVYRDTVVYTQASYENKISEKEMAALPAGLEVKFFWPSWFPERLKNFLPASLSYQLWHLGLFLTLRNEDLEQSYELCQISTWVAATQPVFSCLLPLKTIWGPLGGVALPPMSFFRAHPLRGRVYERVRNLFIRLAPLNFLLQLSYSRSSQIIAAASDAEQWIVRNGLKRPEFIEVIPAITFPDQLELPKDSVKVSSERLQIVTGSRLLLWKGLDILLEALALSQRQDLYLRIFGEGPDLERLESLAFELGIENQVRFEGKVSREDFLQALGAADSFFFASLHDSEGGACMEACGRGVKCVFLDFGGIKSCLNGCSEIVAIEAGDRLTAVQKISEQYKISRKVPENKKGHIPIDSLLYYKNKEQAMFQVYERLADE